MAKQKISSTVKWRLFWLFNLLAGAGTALAQDTGSFSVGKYLKAPGQKKQPLEIANFIVRFINFLSLLIGSFAFLAIVIGGVTLLTSAGREQSLTKGKEIIKYAIMGLVVALAAYFITAFVQSIFYEYGTSAGPSAAPPGEETI